MGKVYPLNGHIRFENAGHVVWSTDRRPVNLLPEDTWISRSLTVAFPDFVKRNAYAFDISTDPLTESETTSCASFVTILPGEWSRSASSPRTLPQQTLGTVPAGIDYIDVRVKLSRTNAPNNYLSFSVPNMLPTQETHLPGGSCLVESSGIWKRLFEIVLSGTSVVLRRYQSVYDGDNNIEWSPGNAIQFSNGGYRQGWTYGGGSDAEDAHLAALIEGKDRTNSSSINRWRGGSNACSLDDDDISFASTWTGSVIIRPGYLAA